MTGKPTTYILIQGTDKEGAIIILYHHAKTLGYRTKEMGTGVYLHKKRKEKYMTVYKGGAYMGNKHCYTFPQSVINKDYNRYTNNFDTNIENIIKQNIDVQNKIVDIEKYIYRYQNPKWSNDAICELGKLYDKCIEYQNEGYSDIKVVYGY